MDSWFKARTLAVLAHNKPRFQSFPHTTSSLDPWNAPESHVIVLWKFCRTCEKSIIPSCSHRFGLHGWFYCTKHNGNICPKVLSFKCIAGVSSHGFHSPPNSTESLPEPKVTVFPRIKPLLCLIHGVHGVHLNSHLYPFIIFIALSNTFQGMHPANQGELLPGWQQTNNGGTRWYPVVPGGTMEKRRSYMATWSRPVSIATREKGCPSDPSSVSIQSSDASDSGNGQLGSWKSWMSYLNPLH